MSTTKVQKAMVQPIHLIFRYLQTKTPIHIWLFEQLSTRLEGVLIVRLLCVSCRRDDVLGDGRIHESRFGPGRGSFR